MRLPRVLTVLAVSALALALAAPVAADSAPAVSARGAVYWNIPLPNVFGVEIDNLLVFDARKSANGQESGQFGYVQHLPETGETFAFRARVTCINVYDGSRAKIGGIITWSNDETQPPGGYMWFQVFDVPGAPDRSSLVGFGDEAANEAFCNSPNLPRFGPWDVHGDVRVRG